jgi:hypothetical protein
LCFFFLFCWEFFCFKVEYNWRAPIENEGYMGVRAIS